MTNKQNTFSEEKSKILVRSKDHHDKFFKRFFSIPIFAKELLFLMFSKKKMEVFDLSKLKIEKDNWANKFADLVISLPLKSHPQQRFLVFILLEHKSKYDPIIWSQLLFYHAGLHDQLRKVGHPMPILLGVFYHGREPWKWPLSFQQGLWGDVLKKLGDLVCCMVDYKIQLLSTHDLRQKRAMSDKSLKIRAVLNLMDKIWELKDSPEELKKAVALFGELTDEREDVILYVLEYLEAMQLVTPASWRALEKQLILEGAFKKGGFMDIREEIKERGIMEGMQKGMQKGIEQGQKELILKLLNRGFDVEAICKGTDFSKEQIDQLKK